MNRETHLRLNKRSPDLQDVQVSGKNGQIATENQIADLLPQSFEERSHVEPRARNPLFHRASILTSAGQKRAIPSFSCLENACSFANMIHTPSQFASREPFSVAYCNNAPRSSSSACSMNAASTERPSMLAYLDGREIGRGPSAMITSCTEYQLCSPRKIEKQATGRQAEICEAMFNEPIDHPSIHQQSPGANSSEMFLMTRPSILHAADSHLRYQ